jgi:hypothetical protein
MYIVHHAMKMDALFLIDFETVKEQVHEEGFAATDATPNIETFDALRVPSGKPGQEPESPPARRLVSLYALLQVFQPFHDRKLRNITDVTITGEAVLICLTNFQSTLLPVFSALLRPGKITSREMAPPQQLLVFI